MDWNSDGLRDIVTGDREGYFNVFIDTGNGLKAYKQIKLMDSTILDVGYNSQPTITDWNHDGKKDLLLGTQDGYIRLYLNQTNDNWPMFRNYTYIQAGGVNINLYRINPYVVDLDKDGKRDLVCGAHDGYLHFFRNEGSDTNPTFSAKVETLSTVSGTFIQPSGTYAYGSRCGFGDWNNDGAIDFLLSGYDGYIEIYLGNQVTDAAVTRIIAPSGNVNSGTVITPQAIVKNLSTNVAYFPVIFTIGDFYTDIKNVSNLSPNDSVLITFDNWIANQPGSHIVKCSTALFRDMNPDNDFITGNVTVTFGVNGWQRLTDVPLTPSGKPPKNGSCIAPLNGSIYLLKANKTPDFYCYTPDISVGTWTQLIDIPLGDKAFGDGKHPKKGAAITAFGEKIYVLRGNNTIGFWSYTTTGTPEWTKLKDIPIGTRKSKYGAKLVYVNKSGQDLIFAMKGSKTAEFYFYSINTDEWLTIENPPTGTSGKFGYKKGSCLAYDGNNLIYILKGYYGDFFSYNILTNTWTELKCLDPAIYRNRERKKKKVKDGAGLAYLNSNIFLLKGGNTNEFWQYDIASNEWLQMEPAELWDIPTGSGKKVKSGGALCVCDNFLYALKGNKTLEFYRHAPLTMTASKTLAPATNQGVMENKIFTDFQNISITPNPVKDYSTVRYNLPSSGPVSIKLYNSYGKLMKSYTLESNHGEIVIDAGELNSGVYVLRLENRKSTLTRKIVLEK